MTNTLVVPASVDLATGCMRDGGMNVRAYPVEIAEDCIRITLPTPVTRHQ
ncbi:hypothetical protein [Pseudomonas fluorescens]|uniref:Uncharacterized protein n=1 Tax=Pseudomonas fluorescens TaxID=294 RepID=A0A5E6TQT9_PSEFL|nr:hypothetical protein [Pseudomonas fluorescens]VVM95709.1 hypothetical protein PS659_03086 [Pseudomonas fluorescens]